VNPRWPLRARKMGRYDAAWQRERAPWYPADFDWGYFNAAPEDQQLPTYLRGDEELQITNLHPTKPLIATRLPGVRVRVFGKRWKDGPSFELPMVLDTLFLDPSDDKVILTWRGLAWAERLDREDVPFVYVAEEPLADPPRPAAEHAAALEAFAADPNDMKSWMTADMAAMQASAGAVELPKTSDGVAAVDALLGKRFGPLAEPQRGPVRDFLRRALGLASTPVKVAPGAPAQGEASAGSALNAALLAAAAAGAQAPRSPGAIGGGGQPSVRLRESVRQVEAAAREAQRSLADQSRRPRAVSQVANLSKDERLRALDPSLAEAGSKKKDPEPKAGGSCRGGNYAGRSFDGQDLSGVDFSHCLLDKTSFRGAKLTGARFEGAIAVEADFGEAILDQAVFLKANASRARFEGASLAGARIEHSTMEEVDLRAVRGEGLHVEEGILRAARLDAASLAGTTWVRSVLDQASLSTTDLRKARLEGCLLNDASAPGLRADEAVLVDTSFLSADLTGASLARATFAGCSFIRARMGKSELGGARGSRAVFIDADLGGARLRGADLRDARFADASLRHADLSGSDLMRADFSRAQLDDASFRGANAYGAYFWDAGGQRTHFDGANLARALPERT
jgi:uncharacterized protein YjbI with pentapeptide repeats